MTEALIQSDIMSCSGSIKVTSTNLNALGEYTFRMIKPEPDDGSTCHTIRAYQDGQYLGEAYYGGILMPKE